jgi:hypothetical protein
MHSGPRPGLGQSIMQRLRGDARLFDPQHPQGRELMRAGCLFRYRLLLPATH